MGLVGVVRIMVFEDCCTLTTATNLREKFLISKYRPTTWLLRLSPIIHCGKDNILVRSYRLVKYDCQLHL